ncbi:hypothetical protein AVEN_59898-1 [Araneus ventricosus]|uniref:Uncharacterized protein n=1 Tax=Araneus ventricosus TaxID=182803 RepID=A0A4Y2EGR3_ARAVE|nr:hypothetical protein AVEN_59898-1 [Araneus ventricosus]
MLITTVRWRAFRLFYSSEYGWRLTLAEVVASREHALRKLWQSPKRNFVLTFSRWTPVINQSHGKSLPSNAGLMVGKRVLQGEAWSDLSDSRGTHDLGDKVGDHFGDKFGDLGDK